MDTQDPLQYRHEANEITTIGEAKARDLFITCLPQGLSYVSGWHLFEKTGLGTSYLIPSHSPNEVGDWVNHELDLPATFPIMKIEQFKSWYINSSWQETLETNQVKMLKEKISGYTIQD